MNKKLCDNCNRREAYKGRDYCSVCGLSSEYEAEAEVQKSPALDGVNRWLDWNRDYIERLEISSARKNSAIDNLICENKVSKNKYCHQLGADVECQVCEIKRTILGE